MRLLNNSVPNTVAPHSNSPGSRQFGRVPVTFALPPTADLSLHQEAKEICENANRYDQPLAKRPSTGVVMVEAPSQHRLKLDLEFPDR